MDDQTKYMLEDVRDEMWKMYTQGLPPTPKVEQEIAAGQAYAAACAALSLGRIEEHLEAIRTSTNGGW